MKAKLIRTHYDRSDRGRDGTSTGRRSAGVAHFELEDGTILQATVVRGQPHGVVEDGQLTSYGEYLLAKSTIGQRSIASIYDAPSESTWPWYDKSRQNTYITVRY